MIELYDREILEILQKSVTAAVQASSTPELPIKFTSITFEVPNDQKYMEFVFIPNNPSDRYWGNEKQYMGFFRLLLHWPLDGSGAYEPMETLASIAGYFGKDLQLQDLRIYETPNIQQPLESGSEIMYPCTIRYQCFRP